MDSPARQPVLSSGQQRFLLCLAGCIVPESAGAPPQVTDPLLAAVDEELQPRPRLQQIEFKLLLFAIRWMTVPFTLRRFERLPPERQAPLAWFSGKCAAHPAARRHLGPQDPGVPRLLHPGRRPAADPLFSLEAGGQPAPATRPGSHGRLTHGRRIRHRDRRLGSRRRHRRAALSPLCAEGARIAVLERGPRFTTTSSPAANSKWRRLFYDGGATASRSDADVASPRLWRLDRGLYRDVDAHPERISGAGTCPACHTPTSRRACRARASEPCPRGGRRGYQREQPAVRRRLPALGYRSSSFR